MAKKAPSKICFGYLATTGEYMGQAVAYLDPIEQTYNLPAQATFVDPAALGDWGEKWPFWNGSAWVLQ